MAIYKYRSSFLNQTLEGLVAFQIKVFKNLPLHNSVLFVGLQLQKTNRYLENIIKKCQIQIQISHGFQLSYRKRVFNTRL